MKKYEVIVEARPSGSCLGVDKWIIAGTFHRKEFAELFALAYKQCWENFLLDAIILEREEEQ